MQLNKSITSGFERMTSCVTTVISLDFCTKSFEKVHLTCEISTKASNKNYNKSLTNYSDGCPSHTGCPKK